MLKGAAAGLAKDAADSSSDRAGSISNSADLAAHAAAAVVAGAGAVTMAVIPDARVAGGACSGRASFGSCC